MCKQKLISNKFDLELVTTFSSQLLRGFIGAPQGLHWGSLEAPLGLRRSSFGTTFGLLLGSLGFLGSPWDALQSPRGLLRASLGLLGASLGLLGVSLGAHQRFFSGSLGLLTGSLLGGSLGLFGDSLEAPFGLLRGSLGAQFRLNICGRFFILLNRSRRLAGNLSEPRGGEFEAVK